VLPGISGFEALRALRRDAATQAIPVILISGNQMATEQFYSYRMAPMTS
jgi:CheY-like chemotaxis protein